MRSSLRVRFFASSLVLCGCAGTPTSVEPVLLASLPALEIPDPELAPADLDATYVAANSQDRDGTPAFIHYEECDMPLRVNINLPRQSARYASRAETREAIIAGMRIWGEAMQAVYPWFAMEFVAHEFGHCLGLRHCLDCDSAMNYSWGTRDRILVTDYDVQTLHALMSRPNGLRTDGKRLVGLDVEDSNP